MKLLLFFSWMGARTHGGILRYFAECVILIACYCSLCTHEIRFCSPTYIYFVWVVIWVGVDDVIQSKYTEALDYSLGVEVSGLNQTVTWIKFFWWRMCYYYYYKIIALFVQHMHDDLVFSADMCMKSRAKSLVGYTVSLSIYEWSMYECVCVTTPFSSYIMPYHTRFSFIQPKMTWQ